MNTSTLRIKSHNINSLYVRHNPEPFKHIQTSLNILSSKISWLVVCIAFTPHPLVCNILWRHKTSITCVRENTQKMHYWSSILIINKFEQIWCFFVITSILTLISIKQLIMEILWWFCSKGWGIKHRFSEPLMLDISHRFCFLYCVIVVINRHNKFKQKRPPNDVRLRRFERSKIVICLIQRGGDNFSHFRKWKICHCNFARSITRLGIFRWFFIVGRRFWLPFNVKCVTFWWLTSWW